MAHDSRLNEARTPTRAFLGRGLAVLRESRGMERAALAQAAGIDTKVVTAYEKGDRTPSTKVLTRLLAVLQSSVPELTRLAGFLSGDAVCSPGMAVGRITRSLENLSSTRLGHPSRRFLDLSDEEAQAEARRVWQILEPWNLESQLEILDEAERISTWALCNLLCEQSLKAAHYDVDRCADHARLAVAVAERVQENNSKRPWIAGFARAHLGNAYRVRGNLSGALTVFREADRHWRSGEPSSRYRNRFLGLQASLLSEQGLPQQALEILKEIPRNDLDGSSGELEILLQICLFTRRVREPEAALTILQTAEPILASNPSSSLSIVYRFNLAKCLFCVGRSEEALPEIHRAQEEAARSGYQLDRLRLRWLRARISAHQRNEPEAVAALREIRAQFQKKMMMLDSALVTLDLVELLQRKHCLRDEVRVLAAETTDLLAAQGIVNEELRERLGAML